MVSAVRIVELPSANREPERCAAYVHMVKRVIPADQQVVSVPPALPARDALRRMKEKGYSQLPVVQGRSVLGIFSYRAFTLEALEALECEGDLPYARKLEHCLKQNLLALSLHPKAYEHDPGFRQFREETGLPFRPHPEFRKCEIDERQTLYRLMAERVWEPAHLMAEAAA